MSYEDEPGEPEPKPADTVTTVTVNVEFSREELLRVVASNLADRAWYANQYSDKDLKTRALDMAVKAVGKRVEELAKSLLDEQVKAALDDIITNGFPVTDTYGNQKSRKTIKQFALEYLDKIEGYDRQSTLNKLKAQFTETAMEELRPEIDELKKKLKAAYGGEATKAIRDAIAKALEV